MRGPSGANDEFIEIYNDSGADHTVAAISGTGYAHRRLGRRHAVHDPERDGHPGAGPLPLREQRRLLARLVSVGERHDGDGRRDVHDRHPGQRGHRALQQQHGRRELHAREPLRRRRLDVRGEHALQGRHRAIPALTPFSIDYSFSRDECGKCGSITTLAPCTISTPKDTDNNAADFIFDDTNGTSAGAGQRLGAPGPQNLSSPISAEAPFASAPPGRERARLRCAEPGPGLHERPREQLDVRHALDLRRRFVNNTGGNVTRLRFRVVDLTTFPAPSGFADLRPRTSVAVVVAGITDAATCAATGTPATPPCR